MINDTNGKQYILTMQMGEREEKIDGAAVTACHRRDGECNNHNKCVQWSHGPVAPSLTHGVGSDSNAGLKPEK